MSSCILYLDFVFFAKPNKAHFSVPPASVLIFRFSSLGDVLLTTPAIEALAKAWPKTKIYLATKKQMAPLLEGNPYLTQIICLEKKESLLHFSRRLRQLEPKVILDLHNKLRSKMLRLLLWKVPAVVWKNRNFIDYFPLPLAWKNYHSRILFADRYHKAAETLVGEALGRGLLYYHPTIEEKSEMQRQLVKMNIDMQRLIVGVAMGTTWETKRWPLPYFIQLIDQIQKKGWQVLLFGNREDVQLSNQIKKQNWSNIFDLCGLPLRGTAAALSYCHAFVCNDSGPMHIARAQGVPVVAIFGSTDPKMFDFQGHALAYSGQPCSPCGFNGRSSCPHKHFRCMLDIHPEQVWALLEPLLQKKEVPYLHA